MHVIPIAVAGITNLLRDLSRAAMGVERRHKATVALQRARRELLSLDPNEDVIEAALEAARAAGITGIDVIWTRRNLGRVQAWNERKKKAGTRKKAAGKRKKKAGVRYKKKAAFRKKVAARRRKVIRHLRGHIH